MWPAVSSQPFTQFKAVVLKLKTLLGVCEVRTIFINKVKKLLLAFYTLILSQVHSGVFQMFYDLQQIVEADRRFQLFMKPDIRVAKM